VPRASRAATPQTMVLFYDSRGSRVIYVGEDKNENEELIKYGLPHDVVRWRRRTRTEG